MKTSELSDALLDYWVAKAERKYEQYVKQRKQMGDYVTIESLEEWVRLTGYSPSTDWSQGGPLIHKMEISVSHYEFYGDGPSKPATLRYWASYYWKPPMKNPIRFNAEDPLIAAMRCIVAAHFGEEVSE